MPRRSPFPPSSRQGSLRARANTLLGGTLLLWLTLVPTAAAQEYAQETGELELESSLVVTVSGGGFVGLSVVFMELFATDSDAVAGLELGTLDTDEAGSFTGALQLPAHLTAGTYVMTATGVTEDGATRVLSAEFAIGSPDTEEEVTAETTVTTAEATTTSSSAAATTSTLAAAPQEEPGGNAERLLLSRVVLAAVVLLGGVWWWLYRAVNR